MKDSCQYTDGGDKKSSQGGPSAWLLDWGVTPAYCKS
jgi:hypothetical protein